MRKFVVLFLSILAFSVFGGVANAQELPTTFCGTLSEADCAILKDSAEAMRSLESAAFNFQLDFGVSNIPEGKPAEVSFRMTGDGAYAVDSEALNAIMLSPTEMMQNLDELPQLLEDAIKAISADVNLVMFLPQNLPNMDQPLPEKIGLGLRLVDGVAYANLDKLAALDTSGKLPKGWIGIDLVEAIQKAMKMQVGAMPTIPDTSASAEMMSLYTDPEFLNSYVTVTRGADTTVDGQNAAVFNQAIDLGALFSSEKFQDMMRAQMNASSASSGMSGANMDSIMQIYSKLFDGFVINATQTIGLEDHYVHQASAKLDWALDFGGMMGSFGGGGSASKMEPINISFNLQGNLSQFNNAPEITAPEDAIMIPLDSIFGRTFRD